MVAFAIVFSFILVLVLPETVFAWGPATHLEIGYAILSKTGSLATPVKLLIETFPYDYLYGNVSADIVVGKNLVEEMKHCHNWKIGFKLLKNAESNSQKAFALGYLSHLAADTIAHNNFIPEMMIRSFSARTLKHIYWEMRFDALSDKRVWELPKKMIREIHDDNDRLLDSIIEDTPLSFRANKTIFSSMMSLQRFQQWHRMLNLLSDRSRWALHREDKEKFFTASVEAVMGLLKLKHKAACVKKDPTGKHNLNAAKFMRKKLKTIQKQGKDWQEAMDNALIWVKI